MEVDNGTMARRRPTMSSSIARRADVLRAGEESSSFYGVWHNDARAPDGLMAVVGRFVPIGH